MPASRGGWMGVVCRAILELEVAIMVFTSASWLVDPVQWAQKLGGGVLGGLDAYRGCSAIARNGGAGIAALAAVLQLGLISKSGGTLELVLKALLLGDVVQLVACVLIARDAGWTLDEMNGAGVGVTLLFAVARLGLLSGLRRQGGTAAGKPGPVAGGSGKDE